MTHSYQTCEWAPYGAFELKARYQRNLLIGQLTVITLITLILITAWLYPKAPVVVVEDRIVPKGGPIIISPPPTIKRDNKPFGQSNHSKPPIDNKGMIPVPIPDGELEIENQLPTRIERAQMIGAGISDSGVIRGNYRIDTTFGDDYIPERGEFVPVEIYPDMIHEHQPEYPRLAKLAGLEGEVLIEALVGPEGKVLEVVVAKSSETTSLDEAAVKAAYQCRFSPGIQNGRPIACWVTYKVEFKLR